MIHLTARLDVIDVRFKRTFPALPAIVQASQIDADQTTRTGPGCK